MKVKRRTGLVDVLTKRSQRRVRASVAGISADSVPDATTETKGKLKLAGDLGGTSDAPTVESVSSISKVSGLVGELSFKQPLGSLLYTYSTDTANSDPGSGKLKFNTTSLGSIATLRISETDAYGQAVSGILSAWDDLSDTRRALVIMRKVGSNTVFRAFYLTGAYSDQGAWGALSVSNLAGNGSFANNDVVVLEVLFGVSLPGHGTAHKKDGSDEIKLHELGLPTADVPMNTRKFTGLQQGSAAGHSAEYSQMIAGDVAAQLGFTMKPAVYAASIAALPAHGRSGDVLTASGNGFLAPSFGTLKFSWASGVAGTGNGQFDETYDVALDSGGNIFVLDRGNSRVQKFNSSGVYQSQFSIGAIGYGLAIDSSDNVWVAGFSGVYRYNSSGTLLGSTAYDGSLGTAYAEGGIALDSSGNAFVPTRAPASNAYRVQKFNSSGTFQSQFGATGSGNGQLSSPRAIVCDASNNIFVADSGNHRVQKFNSAGVYQSKFGTVGKEDGQFLGPTGIEIDSGGNIWVSDHFNNRVQKFNSAGTFQAKYGSLGSGNGQMLGPRGLVVTSGGDLIVADSYNNRVQRFTAFTLSAGQFVLVRHEGGGTHIENNIYEVTNPGGASAQWVLTLRSDGATGFLKAQNMVIAQVENATQNRVFTLTTSDPITVWTTPLTWERFEPGGPPSPHASNHSPGGSDPIPELEELMPLLDDEPWIEIGSGGSAPAFANSWVNDGGAGLETAAFYKDPFGIVRLKGRVKSGTVAATMFTLPAGYRPAATSDHAVVSNFAFGRVTIATNGNVTLGVGSNTWASLSGITFRAA